MLRLITARIGASGGGPEIMKDRGDISPGLRQDCSARGDPTVKPQYICTSSL